VQLVGQGADAVVFFVGSILFTLAAADELTAQLRDCGARLVVTVPAQLEKATAAAERAGVEEIFVYGEAEGATPFALLLRAVGKPPEVGQAQTGIGHRPIQGSVERA
jgi:hypothetical protein